MKTAQHWAHQIINDLYSDDTLEERSRHLVSMIQMIQADALEANGPSDAKLLLEYHEQQKEFHRTNTNDPHHISTALYVMHCELVNIYDAIVSGDARRNFEHNAKAAP